MGRPGRGVPGAPVPRRPRRERRRRRRARDRRPADADRPLRLHRPRRPLPRHHARGDHPGVRRGGHRARQHDPGHGPHREPRALHGAGRGHPARAAPALGADARHHRGADRRPVGHDRGLRPRVAYAGGAAAPPRGLAGRALPRHAGRGRDPAGPLPRVRPRRPGPPARVGREVGGPGQAGVRHLRPHRAGDHRRRRAAAPRRARPVVTAGHRLVVRCPAHGRRGGAGRARRRRGRGPGRTRLPRPGRTRPRPATCPAYVCCRSSTRSCAATTPSSATAS